MFDIAARVRKIVAVALGRPVEIDQDDTPFCELGADSLTRVEIVLDLETEFGIAINDDETEALACTADILKLIRRVTGAAHVG